MKVNSSLQTLYCNWKIQIWFTAW